VSRRREPRAFTLAELLVVIGVIAILGTLTVISVQRISRDTRTATATNTVTNALAAARAHAIKTNNLVMVVFRPVWNPNQRQSPQQTEAVICEWTGRSYEFLPEQLADVYVPANGFQPLKLAPGVKVAGPVYELGTATDSTWATQPDLARTMGGSGVPACSEPITYSRILGVLFGSDGSRLTRNPNGATSDNKSFVDFNRIDSNGDGDPQDCQLGTCANGNFQIFWLQDHAEDESNITLVPFLAVYDDRAARERRTQDWTSDAALATDLVGPQGYISTSSDRIHFNRYTGVAEVIAP
jgi:prepilin-type N-terminal cleavage/methylation domain-containing protein